MKIYAPVKDANGVYASVMFVNGVGETDNPALIRWFKTHGYKVPIEKCEKQVNIHYEKCDTHDSEFVEINKLSDEVDDKPDFEAMTPTDLREWMKANGYGAVIKNTRNKEKLLEILRGE